MTICATNHACDLSPLNEHLLFLALTRGVAELVAIVALRNAAVHWDTCIGEALEVLLGRSWPALLHVWSLRLVGGEVADSVLLTDFTLQVDDSEGITMILLLSRIKMSVSVGLNEYQGAVPWR